MFLALQITRGRGITMKRPQLLLIALLMLLFCSPIYAAAVPDRTGNVTDPAGVFTATQAKQIGDGLKGRNYEVFLLTARGLTESAAEQLGNDAYSAWKLSPKQLVLVVTAEPDSVHIVYDNEELAKAVSNSEAGNAKGLIDLNYVPLASKGKAAEGVIAVSNYVNSLPVAAQSGPAGQGKGAASGGAGSANGGAAGTAPGGAAGTGPSGAAGAVPGGATGTAPGDAIGSTTGGTTPGGAASGSPSAAPAATSRGLSSGVLIAIAIFLALIAAFFVSRLYRSRK
jgi:hypothetical protein